MFNLQTFDLSSYSTGNILKQLAFTFEFETDINLVNTNEALEIQGMVSVLVLDTHV